MNTNSTANDSVQKAYDILCDAMYGEGSETLNAHGLTAAIEEALGFLGKALE